MLGQLDHCLRTGQTYHEPRPSPPSRSQLDRQFEAEPTGCGVMCITAIDVIAQSLRVRLCRGAIRAGNGFSDPEIDGWCRAGGSSRPSYAGRGLMAADQRGGPGVGSGRSVRVVGESAAAPAGFEVARAVADAVLYEGYLLYPYRRSSGKNRVRWQFGVLVPRTWLEVSGVPDASVAGSADAWHQQTDCLLEARDTATVHVWLRFLQLQNRLVETRCTGGSFQPVDVLDVDGQRYLTFDEAVPREFHVVAEVGELRRAPHTVGIEVPGGEDIEQLRHGEAGRVVRQRWPVSATVWLSVTIADAPFRLLRLRLVTENTADSVAAGVSRSEVLRTSLVATHSVLGVRGGSFVSLLDPPAWAAGAAKNCRNVHTFPVLAGDPDGQDVMLSSPILMYDHPQISPESPGDLFDATEIDEILSLRTLALTDEEKREARATDPHPAAIIDRVDTIPREVLERLHGAVRSLRPVATGCDGAGGVIADELPTPPAARRNPVPTRRHFRRPAP
jgi:hypothetical protein